jgi:hypothetical protein
MLKLPLGNPYVILGVAAAFALSIGAAIWFRHEAGVAREAQAVAERQAAISAADAERWEAAWSVATARVTELGATLDQQSAAITAGRAKEAELRQSLDSAREQNDRLSGDLDAVKREIAEEVGKAPGDVVPLGPIVLKRAEALFQ